ncbi:hypothetical protein U2P60_10900 [Brucella sp. H1_1004]|uniref:hypothetical protein n=1 Tax=Brucella sp. H1_1004 TaxID=3110109 RepID=UPI0039B540B6
MRLAQLHGKRKIEAFPSLVEILLQTALQTTQHCLPKQIGGKMKNPVVTMQKNQSRIGSPLDCRYG